MSNLKAQIQAAAAAKARELADKGETDRLKREGDEAQSLARHRHAIQFLLKDETILLLIKRAIEKTGEDTAYYIIVDGAAELAEPSNLPHGRSMIPLNVSYRAGDLNDIYLSSLKDAFSEKESRRSELLGEGIKVSLMADRELNPMLIIDFAQAAL